MTSEKDEMVLVYVPSGDFTMGSDNGGDDEKPVRTVSLNAFWIDQTEVTNAMYAKCVSAQQCDPPESDRSFVRANYYGNQEFDHYPVIYVSWNDAQKYCSWAERRLPTEAEWEKAARGTEGNIYPWGNTAPNNDLLNYSGAVGDTTKVGAYPDGQSIYGALDMAGNVWEWVNDWYDANYYDNLPSSNPSGPVSGQYRVLRGGSWYGDLGSLGSGVRSALRSGRSPDFINVNIGFRCACSK